MKILILFILSFSSLYSQESAFEEVKFNLSNGELVNTKYIGHPYSKGDTIFVSISNNEGVEFGMFSINNGTTWENIYPSLRELNIIDNYRHIELNPTSFEFYTKTSISDSSVLKFYNLRGELSRTVYLNSYIDEVKQNPINPKVFLGF